MINNGFFKIKLYLLLQQLKTNIMAKSKGSDKKMNISIFRSKSKVKRPGRHSKKKTSSLKTSKNYVKLYGGQGK